MSKSIKLTWRGGEYDFTPRFLDGSPDNWNRNSNADAPIFGADTESVQLADRYEMQCFTLSSEYSDHIEYVNERTIGIYDFLNFICRNYGAYLEEKKQAFIYFHNLSYDWLEMVKYDPVLLEMARIGQSPEQDIIIGNLDSGYKMILKESGLFVGSAPHFSIKLQRSTRHSFTLHFRDTFSFFPGSLASVSKDLDLPQKMERQLDLGRVDYRLPENQNDDKIYFDEYAITDAVNTRLIAEKIRELHLDANMTKLRPSSPGYAIASVLHGMGEERQIFTGTWDAEIMQLIIDTYRGGRTGGIYHGKISGIYVYDFNSSYPASMCSLPSFSPTMVYHRFENPTLNDVMEILKDTGNMFLRVSGEETDSRYPSLLTANKGKLMPVYGKFENIATTGVELYAGIKSGTLKIDKVHDAVVLVDIEEEPFLPFKHFAETGYETKKNSKKGTVTYIGAKLKLNSAYGKLIESRNNTLIGATDQWVFLPYLPALEKEFSQYYYTKYVELKQENKTLYDSFDDVTEEVYSLFGDGDSVDYAKKAFGDFSLTGRVYGRYVIPAAASLITATSRARLLVAMKATGALYWDTDSVFIQSKNPEEIAADLLRAGDWLPANVKPVALGDELGDLDCEAQNADGYLAGTKRYYFKYQSSDGNEKVKAASHGIPALPWSEIENAIRQLATGENFGYDSKPRPLKSKEAKEAESIGSFRIGSYESQFHLDDRLHWTPTEKGWIGNVTKWEDAANEESCAAENTQTSSDNLFDQEDG